MFNNSRYTIGDGVVYHSAYHYDYLTSSVPLSEEKEDGTELYCTGPELMEIVRKVRPVSKDEMPSWMSEQRMVEWKIERRVVAEIVDNELIIHDANAIETDGCSHSDCCHIIDFAMQALFVKNKYLYKMLTTSTAVNGINVFDFANGLIKMLVNPKRMTVIETMAKTIGEKMAISAIQSDMEVTNGKKAAVLSQSQMHSLKTLKLDTALPTFQRMVQSGVTSIDQMDEILQGMKYLIKYKFISATELSNLMSRYEDAIVEHKIDFRVVLSNSIKSFFTLCNVKPDARRSYYGYGYYGITNIKSICSHYLDAICMLPAEQACDPKYYRRVPDVERYHVITTRNVGIMKTSRASEFAVAAERLRKLKWEDSRYIYKPFDTEEELFFVGQQYNNCLPVYRDKIIDGAVLVCAYEKNEDGTMAGCPDFVFELTPYLDVLEISTYNNEEITDPVRLEHVRSFRKAKWYLLSNGRNVFREPDEKDAEDAIIS